MCGRCHTQLSSARLLGAPANELPGTRFCFSRAHAEQWSCGIVWPLCNLLNCQAVFPSVLHSHWICTGSVPVCDCVTWGTRLTRRRGAASGRNFCIRNFPGLQPLCDAVRFGHYVREVTSLASTLLYWGYQQNTSVVNGGDLASSRVGVTGSVWRRGRLAGGGRSCRPLTGGARPRGGPRGAQLGPTRSPSMRRQRLSVRVPRHPPRCPPESPPPWLPATCSGELACTSSG